MAKQPAPWTTSDLQRRCRELRRALQARRLASETEIADYWPGGSINHEPSSRGKWTYCYANLVRMMGRAESSHQDEQVAGLLDAALSNTPVRVPCDDGTVRAVHPKSFHALRFLDALDRSVLDLAVMLGRAGEGPEAAKAAVIAPLAESLAVQLWAWILTEGGPDGKATLPFDETETPTPPEWTRALTPRDVIAIAKAHIEVNGRRLRVIAETFPGEAGGQSRLSLSGFLGTAAQELGMRPADVLRRWSLGEVFAQQVAAAQAAREGRQRAEQAHAGAGGR